MSTEHVQTRVRDERLSEQLDEAAEEYGSRSEAVRVALQEKYLDGEDADCDAVPDELADVPLKGRDGYYELVDFVGEGGHLELEAAESILANHLNIGTRSVRNVVTRPLVDAGALAIRQGVHEVAVVVRPLEDPAENADADELPDDGDGADGDGPTVDAPEDAGDRLDELANAEVGE